MLLTFIAHLQEGVVEYTYNPSTLRMETGGSGLQGYRKLEINMGCTKPYLKWGRGGVAQSLQGLKFNLYDQK